MSVDSTPSKADVYVDGEKVGQTPLQFEESSGFFDTKKLRVELEDHTPLDTELMQTEPVWPVLIPAICGAPFSCGLSCLLLQFGTKFGEEYHYRLSSAGAGDEAKTPDQRLLDAERDKNQVIPYRY